MSRWTGLWTGLASLVTVFALAAPAGAAAPPPPLDSGPQIIHPDYDGLTVPWQVALVHTAAGSDLFNGQFCGGTIRDATHIITAAHCVAPDETPGAIKVVAGITDLKAPAATTEVRSVTAISNIPRYEDASLGGDAALLTISPALTGNSAVASLAVVAQGSDDTGKSALISGWGNMDPDGEDFPSRLQAAFIDIYPDSRCSGYRSYDPATMLCAGRTHNDGTIVDTCQGDSGGPVSRYAGNGTNLVFDALIGIVSFGHGCAQQGFPGVYTYVAGTEINRFVRTPVPIPRPVNFAQPSIVGTLRVGGAIACNPGTWTGSPSVSYQWLRVPLVGGRPDTAHVTVAGHARTLALTAIDQGKVMACVVHGVNGGGWMDAGSDGVGPVAPRLAPPPPPPPPRDVTVPTSAFTRAHCRGRRCTLTLLVRDLGGVSGERVVATIKRVRGCPHGRRGRSCRRAKALRVHQAAPGVFTMRTPKLKKGRYRIRARAIDAAGNVQAHAATLGLRVRRR